jgi:hypothetical protein
LPITFVRRLLPTLATNGRICEYSCQTQLHRSYSDRFCAQFSGAENEAIETYALTSLETLSAAVTAVTRYLGMQAAEQSDSVKSGAKKHILYLSGRFVDDVAVLVRVRMRLAKDGKGVSMEVSVRSGSALVSRTLALAIG